MRRVLATLLLLLAPVAAVADTTGARALATYADRLTAFGFSGQIVVVDAGTVVLDRAFGWADRDAGRELAPETGINIASLTKPFVATAILRLEAQGKLAVSDPLRRFLPDAPADKAAITIHQLLTHTAGLRRDTFRGPGPHPAGRDEAVRRILESPLERPPGERFGYSNDGYRLLAAVAEIASGEPLARCLERTVLAPAGLSSTALVTDDRWRERPAAIGTDEARSLEPFVSWPAEWHRLGWGGLVSTARDVARWLEALASGTLLAPAERAKMFARQAAAEEAPWYGYGWFMGDAPDGQPVFFHGGDNPGYHSEVRWYPALRRAIVVLTTQDSFGIDGGALRKRRIASDLGDLLAGRPVREPPAAATLSPEERARFVGLYRLPEGGAVEVRDWGGRLVIGAEGQAVIAAFGAADRQVEAGAQAAGERAQALLDLVGTGRAEEARRLLSAAEFEDYVPFLEGQIHDAIAEKGALRGIRVLGTVPFPWDPAQYRSYARMELARGSVDLFVGWGEKGLNDVTVGQARPYPLLLPAAPISATELATWDFFANRSVVLRFRGEGSGGFLALELPGGPDARVARRADRARGLDLEPAAGEDRVAPGWRNW